MTAVRRTRSSPESESVQRHAGAKSPEAFRTIGEASEELGLKPHVLRFWETRFTALAPMKRPDGRRYYRPEDMALLRTLKHLLHEQGLTIRGALKVLREQGHAGLPGEADGDEQTEDGVSVDLEGAGVELAAPVDEAEGAAGLSVRELQHAVHDAVERGDFREAAASGQSQARERLEALLTDLCDLKSRLDAVRLAH